MISNGVPPVETHLTEDEPVDPLVDEPLLDGAVEQEVEAYPVLVETVEVERVWLASRPAVQAAALAATGFVAGAATVALVRRHNVRRRLEQAALREAREVGELSRRARATTRRAKRPVEEQPPSVSYLVNIRLLSRTEN